MSYGHGIRVVGWQALNLRQYLQTDLQFVGVNRHRGILTRGWIRGGASALRSAAAGWFADNECATPGGSATDAVGPATGPTRKSPIRISAAPAGRPQQAGGQGPGTNAPATGVYAGFTDGVDLYLVDTKLLPGPCEPALNAEFDLCESRPNAVLDLTGSPLGVGTSGPFSFSYPIEAARLRPARHSRCRKRPVLSALTDDLGRGSWSHHRLGVPSSPVSTRRGARRRAPSLLVPIVVGGRKVPPCILVGRALPDRTQLCRSEEGGTDGGRRCDSGNPWVQ